jgi:flagellar hook-basal body complex protein FliE
MIEAVSAMAGVLSDLQDMASAASGPRIGKPDAALGLGVGVDAAPGTSFSGALKSAIERVDGTVASANSAAQSFAAGNHDIPLSDVMVSLEQANLGLQLTANVRDKVVSAYSSIMNMQV